MLHTMLEQKSVALKLRIEKIITAYLYKRVYINKL